ncbi:DUF2341 domain-containing protein [Pseudoxanthomonas beigongshangi]|jgi:biopolymer transport protein ExbB
MQRVLILLLTCLGLFLPGLAWAQAPASWWQADWKYRKPITVDAGPQGAGLGAGVGRMPVLVRLHTGNFAFDGVGQGGKDLRFLAADGRTVLNHQVELYDADLGMALIWVDVPAVAASAQTLWMYYGNPKAPAAGNGQLVFDPDYTAVYHFAGPDTQARDVTAYANHATGAFTPLAAAVIGRGAQRGEALQLPASASLAVPAGGSLTFSAWVKPEQLGPTQAVYARRDGEHALLLGVDNGVPFVQVDQARSAPVPALTAGQWSHLAFTADAGGVVLYVGGREAARLAGPLPALAGPARLGADPLAAGASAPVPAAQPFAGALDEVRLSKVARPAGLLRAEALSQGSASRLTAFGEDEQNAGVSHFGFILKAMPVDAWVVVAILTAMLLLSWALMLTKGRYFGVVTRANAAFSAQYQQVAGQPAATLQERAGTGALGQDVRQASSLWRLYAIAMAELKGRQAHAHGLSAAALAAIRAAMDAELIRETERMGRRMNWLSTTIEGAPYVGLFGTVIGIMLVFAVAAMAGAVDINSVAPGMAAALLCTAAGLGVAIPALFGYNWLAARAEAIAADMAVFVDEFSARLAEEFDAAGATPPVLHSVRA